MKIETARLLLREMTPDDLPALEAIMRDEQTMYAYNGAFTTPDIEAWLNKQRENYRKWGFGLWAVVLKATGEMIGQCGLTMQDYNGTQVLEVGYLFQRAYWHQGYASEAAIACKRYAFDELKAQEVYSLIKDDNQASMNVALRNGMVKVGSFVKFYRGINMGHYAFCVRKIEEKKSR